MQAIFHVLQVRADSPRVKLDVQGRFEQVQDSPYGKVMATELTAVAAKDNVSATVEVRLRPRYAQWRYKLDVLVDQQPIYFDRIPVMSMGLLIDEDQPVVWRGPKLHGAVTQFLRDTYWGPLDYLIIDMPPGTGDIALTLSQAVPLSGAVVVCTPQQVALLDAVKAISMFGLTKIPVLGMVENMSGFICPDNGKRYDIFGAGGARQKAEEKNVAFLGEVPLNMQLRQESDDGNLQTALQDPICKTALEKIVRAMCTRINDRAAAAPNGPSLPVL